MKYRQIVRAISETPWAILPATLAVILDIVALRADGGQLDENEIRERVGGRPSRRDAVTAGAVGILPLYGVIMPRADLMSEMSGGTSLQRFMTSFRELVNNDQVGSILIDVDSPGGSVSGLTEAAAEIRAARSRKPIVAIANYTMASAAYHIAAAAQEIVITPSGLAGSIGVIAAHDDMSAMQEKLGVKTTLISAGKYKTEGNPFEPLSDEARAAIQRRVDDAYAVFVNDIAKSRGVSADDVRAGFGQGRMLSAKAAVKEGLADRVATFDETVTRLARGGGAPTGDRAEEPQVRIIEIAHTESAPPDDVPEPATASPPIVPGAERLLSRRSFRDAFSQ